MQEVPLANHLIIPVETPPPPPRKKIGIVIPVLAYFPGLADLMLSVKTRHEYRVYIQPQYVHQVSLAQAWNHGCDQAWEEECDYALVCNDDILFAPDCIDKMVEEYDRLRPEGVIMVTPNNILGQLGDKFAILHHPPQPLPTSFSDHPNFSCFLVTKEYFDLVGRFDQNFNPAYFEDNDSHRRATLAGLREITTTAANTVHIGGATSHLVPPNSGPSSAYYVEKWGGLPSSHPVADDIKEKFTTPYNDPSLTVRDWRGQA